ncbi:hypothetical protein GALMADRAFT_61920 [Galerina marginata CBS 339.88]|uniref:Uncharacterized protein n=1 Tax=Galerina marginata (strain CBS 339.88) TaxID=685588 RepID=A0A067TAL5_GALM3|nr:hypothetical protein GALMADRAFT_61920 [Galerina marginata CBS 339.88]
MAPPIVDDFRVYVTTFLALLAACSLLSLFAPITPKIGGPFSPFSPECVLVELKGDQFNMTKTTDDFVDGYPTRSVGFFWAQMYRRKFLLVFLQTATLCATGYAIANECISHSCNRHIFQAEGLQLLFSAYVLVVVLLSLQNEQKNHARCVIHLSVLLTTKVLLMTTVSLLPSSNTAEPSLHHYIFNSWNLDLACTFISWMIVGSTPRSSLYHYPPENLYSSKTISTSGKFPEENVSGETVTSLFGFVLFSYATEVFMLGRSKNLITMDQLPILPASLRAAVNLSKMKYVTRTVKLPFKSLARPGSGFQLAYQLVRANLRLICAIQLVSVVAAITFYAPIFFIQLFLAYLERDPDRRDRAWGWAFVIGIFGTHCILILVNSQLWSLATNNLNTSLSLQLNTLLYSKTLLRKDLPSNSGGPSNELESKADFSSKAEVMTLMTTDVNRARKFSRLVFSLTDATIGISVGTYMLYNLLGVSAFVGLAVAIVLVPLNQLAGNFVVAYQQNVMKCRDERVALTNEFLGAIRMIKSMAWERNFEKRILKVRAKELEFQKRIFFLETLWNSLGNSIPLLFALGCFWHFAVIMRQELTPAIAFTAIVIFGEIKYALNELPEFLVTGLQAFVSLKRIETYLNVEEVESQMDHHTQTGLGVALYSATMSWPQVRTTSVHSTPKTAFSLVDVTTTFPQGEISLVCGRIGSGKTLLLLGLLGEADVLAGGISCPHSSPDSHSFLAVINETERWVVDGVCAYVPQTPWLRNQSIKENILFGLPHHAERYNDVLEACALVHDLDILEDGDESEIGEQGINLSGGQKARVSLARAVYSRASILLLDDVLSAVDAHTAHHLWHNCFKGNLMNGRTVILVSHHIQLCGPDASLILALESGRVQYSGPWESFQGSAIMNSILVSSHTLPESEEADATQIEEITDDSAPSQAQIKGPEISIAKLPASNGPSSAATTRPEARKLIKDEKRFQGRVSWTVWLLYARANGGLPFWAIFWFVLILSSLSSIWENGWLKIWSAAENTSERAVFFISVYAVVEISIKILRWLIIFNGSIHASKVLYEKLLEVVLFANIRFHDTISRGVLLNRFGKDFEAIDNDLPNELGRALMTGMALIVTIGSMTFVGGWLFLLASISIIIMSFFSKSKILPPYMIFGQVARDLRRLSSITSSPLFSIYGETISGLTVIRAFGMSTKFLKDMIVCADTNMNPFYWSVGLNRWLTVRFQLATGGLMGLMALVILVTPSIDASWAGLALAFGSTLTTDVGISPIFGIRRYIEVQQHMVALERVKEYSDLPSDPPEFVEPRPPAAWPTSGLIQCENLFIKYAPELPDVLHGISFEIKPGEKVGLIGRTGSGKSTVGLALLRFVEAREGKILIDGLDISKMGLTDLRSRLTIVPQDPVLLSGTLRSTLDVFGDYDDAEIYEALRRVNLLPSPGMAPGDAEDSSFEHSTVFSNLDAPVSELGDNFSTGEKQLLCMARALLRRSRVLLMDEVSSFFWEVVDFATDEIISKTVREEFADSTIITIAHRLRTVIDYDRVMVLNEGRIVEFDKPGTLINDENSWFHKLCQAAGLEEFGKLKAMTR